MSIEGFIDRLSCTEAPIGAFNMYHGNSIESVIRRDNLRLYLERMQAAGPSVMLLSEAPGYLGCRRTGVPFTSEYIMLRGIPPLAMFGPDSGFKKAVDDGVVRKEQSATIVWGTLEQLNFLPLIWSSYPFHPHKPGEPASNRPPTQMELALGRSFIQEIMASFGIQAVAAVGRKAEATLGSLGIQPVAQIRHPANGGARQFATGIAELASRF